MRGVWELEEEEEVRPVQEQHAGGKDGRDRLRGSDLHSTRLPHRLRRESALQGAGGGRAEEWRDSGLLGSAQGGRGAGDGEEGETLAVVHVQGHGFACEPLPAGCSLLPPPEARGCDLPADADRAFGVRR
eukprot:399096-Hanusia_phi.AAC.1